jgi:two-component sensor histidine kinase
MLQQFNERQADAPAHADAAEKRTKEAVDPSLRSGQRRRAHRWRLLSRSYDFQHALDRFISFQNSRKVDGSETEGDARFTLRPMLASVTTSESVFLDRLARRIESIRPFSAAALAIAVTALAIATLLRWVSDSTPVDPRFGVDIVAIMATGLLAGLPAAIVTAVVSIFISFYALVPPYFQFAWPGTSDQINIAIDAVTSLATISFTQCCRVVLLRLYRRQIANQILVNELQHRGRNMLSINEVIVQKSLADEPQRAEKIIGRFRAVQKANNLLTGTTAHPITLRELLAIEFAPYDEKRLVTVGPEIEVAPETVRHLLLIFHELVTNAAKYGALSSSEGRIKMQWQWVGDRRVALTWTESGGPKVRLPTRNGFGSQLIDICVNALGGTIEKNFSRDGFSCTIAARIG